jgi:peroxiredoxin
VAVRDRLDELEPAEVALITFTRPRNLRGYRARLALPFPVLSDEDRSSYRAYGLGRGAWWRVWGLSVWWRYAALMARGRRLRRPTEDVRQLGGDFVVGSDGRIVYAFRSQGPADRPPVAALAAAVGRGTAGAGR